MTQKRTAYHEAYFDAWNEHAPERVIEQFAAGGTYSDPTLDAPLSGPEIVDYIDGLDTAFPDYHIDARRVLRADGGDIVMTEWTMSGTHHGPLDGVPATGRQFTIDGVDVITVSDAGLTSVRGYFDPDRVAEQLGLTFPTIVRQAPTLLAGAVKNTVG